MQENQCTVEDQLSDITDACSELLSVAACSELSDSACSELVSDDACSGLLDYACSELMSDDACSELSVAACSELSVAACLELLFDAARSELFSNAALRLYHKWLRKRMYFTSVQQLKTILNSTQILSTTDIHIKFSFFNNYVNLTVQ